METNAEQITNVRTKTDLSTHDFFYELPECLIAQTPAEKRDACRLMVLDCESGAVSHEIPPCGRRSARR